MEIAFLQKRLKDIPISRKLYFTIGVMALFITIELFTLGFAISTLSAVRSYVSGEGLWSKAQKNAVFHLRIYAYSHDEKDYQDFREFLKVPMGDSKARKEMARPNPNLDIVREGFIEGRNHPGDVDGMIKLMRRFYWISYINKAIIVWAGADSALSELIPVAEELHVNIQNNKINNAETDRILQRVGALNAKLTLLEDAFSFTLGEGSRWLENLILKLLIALTLTVESISILIAISVSRGIEKGLKEILNGARLIGKGLLNTRVKVYSRDEIGALATSFNQMTDALESNIQELQSTRETAMKEKERAEASEKVKRLFLLNMNHEIRTPMNAIIGFAKILEDADLNKEQQEYIRNIVKSGNDLLTILEDIFDFSRIESGKISFEESPFKVRELIASTLVLMDPQSKAKGLELKSSVAPDVPQVWAGDALRLNQVLVNLISNAVKFTEHGSIRVEVNKLHEDEERVLAEFIVRDTGIGIPRDKQAKVFGIFEQASSGTSRNFGGTGLGLSIVKQLLDLQGGMISVDSEPGVGSTFRFSLGFSKCGDMPKVNGHALTPATVAGKNGRKLNILVAEDNKVNQLLMAKVLEKKGFGFDIAENGKLAYEKFLNNEYDLILMDLEMPVMDGYEATECIRSYSGSNRNIPIIAVTAHTIAGEMEKCMDIGMNHFIAKPFDANELYAKIYELAGQHA